MEPSGSAVLYTAHVHVHVVHRHSPGIRTGKRGLDMGILAPRVRGFKPLSKHAAYSIQL